MIYQCCDEKRKAAVLGSPLLNGIDYLEVLDHDAIPLASERQRTLLLHCLNRVPSGLAPTNVLILGGESITDIPVQWIAPASAPPPQASAKESAYFTALPDAQKTLVVRTLRAGDFAPYTLRLVKDAVSAREDAFSVTEVLSGFDPQLAEVTFSFKVECGPDFDCAPAPAECPPDLPPPPPINCLAKDYGSFRSILLDRLNQLLPAWGASAEADIGVAAAELIAYVSDHFSYQQDAVATEAYLRTARSRVSLRRHALLVDYRVHDGCNARAWVRLQVSANAFLDRALTRFYTFAPGMPPTLAVGAGNEEAALMAGVIVFQPMQDARLFHEHNQMDFYTWGDSNCCLLKGATEATLRGTFPDLQAGDVLIFQEVLGPQTGNPADADIRHRCAVRLTRVSTQNVQGNSLEDPSFDVSGEAIVSSFQQPTPVTEIEWSAEDALSFPVCISSTFLDSTGDMQTLTGVTSVFGNIVLADHGLSFTDQPLGTVPSPSLFQPPNVAADRCHPSARIPFPVRFRPQLPDGPVTQAVPLPLAGSPVTPAPVPLLSTGYVSLTDAEGFIALMVEAASPSTWPQYLGIVAAANTIHPAHFDLSVVYNPPGGPTGVPGPVILERFLNLSLTLADPNYAVTQLDALSKFVRVPSTYTPPAIAPTVFPTAPSMLSNTAPINLEDINGIAYLTLNPTTPYAWPPSFAVLAQGSLQQPALFNLLVVYLPPSGGVSVQTPIVVEQFNAVTLANVADHFASNSQLVTVHSFAEEPNPSLSAYSLLHYAGDQAVPVLSLAGSLHGLTSTWTAQPDLLSDGPQDHNFVVEVESNGSARLRFGDNGNGLRPESGTAFTASYRIGNGSSGNVGAESLVFLAAADPRILSCTNPMPATGGTNPETSEQIRRRAPQAFLSQERAITMADYQAVAERNSQVEQALATPRWTGSWYTVFVTAEPDGGGNLTPALRKSLCQSIDRYRLAGEDFELESPQYVSLEIELTVCVDPDYFNSDVRQSLLQVLGSKCMPNGLPGLFYPENFILGQTVYLSRIYAAARQVAGVETVTASVFEPQGVRTKIFLAKGFIPLGRLQVARLENDLSFPGHGLLNLVVQGGK